MSREKIDSQKKEFSECDRNNYYLLVERECSENINFFSENDNAKSDNKIIAIELLITTIFMGIVFYFVAPKISQTIQEAGINSAKQVLLE